MITTEFHLLKEKKRAIDVNRNDNDVYFTLATSDSRIGKYKTENNRHIKTEVCIMSPNLVGSVKTCARHLNYCIFPEHWADLFSCQAFRLF